MEVLPKEVRPPTPSDTKLMLREEGVPIPKNNEELKTAKAEERRKAEERVERLFLTELLSKTHGNVSEAARQAGMNRSWLAQLVRKHQLDLTPFRRGVGE